MKGQNLSHLFILTLKILSKHLWCSLLSLKNKRIYPTAPTVCGMFLQGMFLVHFTFLLQCRDSSNDPTMSTGIPADPLALRISSSSPRLQLITPPITVTLMIIDKSFHLSVLQLDWYLSILQIPKARHRKYFAQSNSDTQNPHLQSLSLPPFSRVL